MAVGLCYLSNGLGVAALTAFKPFQLFATFILATLLMCVKRIAIKTLYEITNTGAQAM